MSELAQVSLDSGEMIDFLQHIIDNNRHIQKNGKLPAAVEVIGESGLGKTSVVLQVAEKNNLNCVKLNLAQIEELGDLVGFPVRQFELCKEGGKAGEKMVMKEVTLPNGLKVKKKVPVATEGTSECMWVDEAATEQYTKQGFEFTGNKRMTYCAPEWIADKKEGGILILDDWNRADIRFIQAVMEIVDRQEYISWKLPKDWHILLTANPDNGEYLVNAIDNAQKTRFISVMMKWNEERWAEWAESQEIDDRCINFVLLQPEVIKGTVNPRSITTFFNAISSFDNFDNHLGMIQMIGEGSVGLETATLFTSFINNRLDKLVTPKEMLHGKGDQSILDKLKEAINPNGDVRADIASILATRLINYTVIYSETNPITQEIVDRLKVLIKEESLFMNDIKFHLVKKLVNGNKTKFQKLLMDAEIQNMVMQ